MKKLFNIPLKAFLIAVIVLLLVNAVLFSLNHKPSEKASNPFIKLQIKQLQEKLETKEVAIFDLQERLKAKEYGIKLRESQKTSLKADLNEQIEGISALYLEAYQAYSETHVAHNKLVKKYNKFLDEYKKTREEIQELKDCVLLAGEMYDELVAKHNELVAEYNRLASYTNRSSYSPPPENNSPWRELLRGLPNAMREFEREKEYRDFLKEATDYYRRDKYKNKIK